MHNNRIINEALNLHEYDFNFETKPLIIGGLAMEFYGLRKRGVDIDLVITNEDYVKLSGQYPQNKKDIWGDLGVVIGNFEIWRSIMLLDYNFYAEGSVEFSDYMVVSFDKLFFMRSLALHVEKYKKDFDLMKESILKKQHTEFKNYADKHIDSYKSSPGGVVFNDKYL
ncbi:MAG: hypothetical protein KAZ87_08880 [Spirochaetes bacterium]|nr:hypothetical protein [Spirochaetota bacterium]